MSEVAVISERGYPITCPTCGNPHASSSLSDPWIEITKWQEKLWLELYARALEQNDEPNAARYVAKQRFVQIRAEIADQDPPGREDFEDYM